MSLPAHAEGFAELVEDFEVFSGPDLAAADIESGCCFELTPEQMREWSETGELTVADEWLIE